MRERGNEEAARGDGEGGWRGGRPTRHHQHRPAPPYRRCERPLTGCVGCETHSRDEGRQRRGEGEEGVDEKGEDEATTRGEGATTRGTARGGRDETTSTTPHHPPRWEAPRTPSLTSDCSWGG